MKQQVVITVTSVALVGQKSTIGKSRTGKSYFETDGRKLARRTLSLPGSITKRRTTLALSKPVKCRLGSDGLKSNRRNNLLWIRIEYFNVEELDMTQLCLTA